jgi:hypothetical protein
MPALSDMLVLLSCPESVARCIEKLPTLPARIDEAGENNYFLGKMERGNRDRHKI